MRDFFILSCIFWILIFASCAGLPLLPLIVGALALILLAPIGFGGPRGIGKQLLSRRGLIS